jgi:hypothetical protein
MEKANATTATQTDRTRKDTSMSFNPTLLSQPITVECSCCGHQHGRQVESSNYGTDLAVCDSCGALLGTCFRVACPVNLRFSELVQDEHSPVRYFDLTVLAGDGSVTRTHGWFDERDCCVQQFG